MRSLPRVTLDHFRGALRGFGFADVHGPEAMSLAGFDLYYATGANNARCAVLARWDGQRFVLPLVQIDRLRRNATELQRRRSYMTIVLCIDEGEHIHLWRGDPGAVDSVIEIWRTLTRVFRGRTVVAGFDLLNEPKLTGPGQDGPYWAFMRALVDAVDAIDPLRICITSTWPGGLCQTNPEWGEWAVHIPGTVLTAHNYALFEFTHQGLVDWVGAGKQYDPYDFTVEQALHKAFLWLHAHSLRTGQPVWIGEGSARQDRPGATEWTRHYVQMLRGFRMSGSFHYFIGDPVWQPTDATMAVLSDWFRNG